MIGFENRVYKMSKSLSLPHPWQTGKVWKRDILLDIEIDSNWWDRIRISPFSGAGGLNYDYGDHIILISYHR
jgi:hypothetical protein